MKNKRKKICAKKNEAKGYLREKKRKETLRKWEKERTEKDRKKDRQMEKAGPGR